MKQEQLTEKLEQFYLLWYEIRELYGDWAKKQGTTYNSITTIRTIFREEGHCTQKRICEVQHLPKQTVNAILKNFVDEGYITFAASDQDRRSRLICLTEKGQTYAKNISEALYQKDIEVAGKMGYDRMEALIENLSLYAGYYRSADEQEDRSPEGALRHAAR